MTENRRNSLAIVREMNEGIIPDINTEVYNSNYDIHFYDLPKALDNLNNKYGFEDVANATAAMVCNVGDWDLRIEKRVREWAQNRFMRFAEKNTLETDFVEHISRGNIHSVLLNSFAEQVIKSEGGE